MYRCHYRVTRIEQVRAPANPYRSVLRYLVVILIKIPEKIQREIPGTPFPQSPCKQFITGYLKGKGLEQQLTSNSDEKTLCPRLG